MKRCEELFLAIGGLESARLAKTEETPRSVKRPKPRLVLIAAVIALAALMSPPPRFQRRAAWRPKTF